MSLASERSLYARSLSGDWQSRIELYKKFVHGNSRVRRLGSHYPSLEDFLHDCFTNVLRAGHTFQRPHRLAERVEAVAAWTALERERLRDQVSSGSPAFVRLCAAVEGDEPPIRGRTASYVPPLAGSEDSLHARISAIVGEPQFLLLRALANENATWEGAAADAGKPVNTIGPLMVRAVDRLSRYFGAPPPLNDDLEPVFSDVSATEAAARNADPLKPRGRIIPMQRDPAFYALTPAMRALGVSVPAEVRTITLWEAARASTPPGKPLQEHLDKCYYCADVLRSLLLMQQALLSPTQADFRLCPGASTLLQDPDDAGEEFHRHLEVCAVCRAERTRALWGATGEPVVGVGKKPVRKLAWLVAAAMILVAVLIGGYRRFTARSQAAVHASALQAEEVMGAPPVKVDPKYAALAEQISLNDPRVLASVLPKNQLAFVEARNALSKGNVPEAMLSAQSMVNKDHDPGAQLLYAECLYLQSPGEGYRAMKQAEGMSPRSPFRCWATLQSALIVGDTATAKREISHLSSDPEFGVRAKNILKRMEAIKP